MKLLLAILLVAVIALTDQGKPAEPVCSGVIHGQTMTAAGTRWAEDVGTAIRELSQLSDAVVTPQSWDDFKHRLWTHVLSLWWQSFMAGGSGVQLPPSVIQLRDEQSRAEQAAELQCALRMQELLCGSSAQPPLPPTTPPDAGQTPFDPKQASLAAAGGSGQRPASGPALAADALRQAASNDAKWLGQIPLGVAIAKYESGFNPAAANSSDHVGLWQVSGPNAATLKLGDRTDPYANAKYAYALWKGRGGTWSKDWTTYRTASSHVSEFQQYAVGGGAPTPVAPVPSAPTVGGTCFGGGMAGGTLGAATGLRALGNFGSDHTARVLTFADGTRVGTWNSYYGAIHPGESGPAGVARIRAAMAAIGPQVDILGGQEFSDASHRAAALDGLGPDFYVVAGGTSQPIWVRKTLALTGQTSDHVFHRSDSYEGPGQGERWVNSAEVRLPSGGTMTFVNLHQLPRIQTGNHLNTHWPKRIGWAKRLWSTALGLATAAKAKGAVVVVGDMNYAGDPDGMYAAAGMSQASRVFRDPVGGRVIDQILYAGTTPLTAANPAAASIGGGGPVPANFDQQGNPRTVEQAIAWMSAAIPNGGHGYSVAGHCEGWMTRSYGNSGGYGTAIAHWNAPGPRHVGATQDVPRGALIYFQTGNPAGHVAMSLGGGQLISTDFDGKSFASGKIGTGPISAIEQWGPMLGWRAPDFHVA